MSVCIFCCSEVPINEPCPKCEASPTIMGVVESFVLVLKNATPDERDMAMMFLQSKVCMLCGKPSDDPLGCRCWLEEAEMVQ